MGLTADLLRQVFGASLLEAGERPRGEPWIRISAENLLSVVDQLRSHPEFRCEAFVDLCGVDHLGRRTPRFETVIHLYSTTHGHRVRLFCPVPDDSLTIPSLTRFWSAADWQEREAFDMYGIRFQGHPNLERILSPPGTEEFPQRKDFPLRGSREPRGGL